MQGDPESGKSVFYIALSNRFDQHCEPTFYPLGTWILTTYDVTVLQVTPTGVGVYNQLSLPLFVRNSTSEGILI